MGGMDGKASKDWDEDVPLTTLYPLLDHVKDNGSEDANDDDDDSKPGGAISDTRRPKISSEEVASLHDLLSKMLKYAPAERITAEEASRHSWFTRKFSYKGWEIQ